MADVGPSAIRGSSVGDRGVSTVVGYVLNVAVATLLITGLILAAGNLVADQRERAIRSEFDVIGNRIAADLETADRLIQSADDADVTINTELPEFISGEQYQVAIEPGTESVDVVLSMDQPQVTTVVTINNSTAIADSTVTGGNLEISGSSDGPIEVDNE